MKSNSIKSRLIWAFSLFVGLCLSSCATVNEKSSSVSTENLSSTKSSSFFYIQTNKESETYQQNNWSVNTQILEKKEKPKTHFYDFTIRSDTEKFSIRDINYKYGNYGKWRIIEKKKYLNITPNKATSIAISRFPITIKKSEEPHNQLLQLTLKTEKNETKYINLIFGIQKCIAKNEIEFVCF